MVNLGEDLGGFKMLETRIEDNAKQRAKNKVYIKANGDINLLKNLWRGLKIVVPDALQAFGLSLILFAKEISKNVGRQIPQEYLPAVNAENGGSTCTD